MCNIESYKIDLKALPQGVTNLEFKLDDEYFQAIDAPDIQRGELKSSLSINRTDDFSSSIFIQREWYTYHATSVWTIWIKILKPMTDSSLSSEKNTQKKMTS